MPSHETRVRLELRPYASGGPTRTGVESASVDTLVVAVGSTALARLRQTGTAPIAYRVHLREDAFHASRIAYSVARARSVPRCARRGPDSRRQASADGEPSEI